MADATYVVHFEGLGDDTSKTDGLLFYYGKLTGSDDYEWVPGLTQIAGSISTSVDPRSGDFSLSSFTFPFHASATVIKKLLWRQTRATYQLDGAITAGASTLTITPAASGLANTAVYIEDETIILGSYVGSGVYNITQRGAYESTAQAHDDRRAIFENQPFHRFRQVKMGTYDGADITWRWRGWIDEIKTNAQMTRVEVSCREIFGALTRVKLAAERPNLARLPLSSLRWIAKRSFDQELLLSIYLDGEVDFEQRVSSSVHKTDVDRRRAVYADGVLTTLNVSYEADDFTNPLFGTRIDTELEGLTEIDATTLYRVPRDVYEVALWSKALDEKYVALGEDPVSPTYALNAVGVANDIGENIAYHPLAIAASILLSSYDTSTTALSFDVMGRGWGGELLDFSTSSIITEILNLVRDTRELQIDTFVLGWEPDGFMLWQQVYEKLLRPFGFYLAFDAEGYFTFKRFELMDVAAYDAALDNDVAPLPPLFQYDGKLARSTGRIIAHVGGFPWQPDERERVEVRARGVSRRAGVWGESGVEKFDFSTISSEAVAGGAGRLLDDLANAAALLHDKLPMLMCRVGDNATTSRDYSMGAWVTLDMSLVQDAFLLDGETGTLTEVGTGAQFAGLIVAREFDISTHTYTLGLLLTNFSVQQAVKWRAPSMILTGVSSADFELQCSTTSQFGALTSDAETFTVGQFVEIWNEDGTRWADSEPKEITAVADGQLTIEENWYASDPSAGMIVRLADLSNYVEVVHSNITRTFVYFDNSDIYG